MVTKSLGYYVLCGSPAYYPSGGLADMLFADHGLSKVLACISPAKPFDLNWPEWEITVGDKVTDVNWFEVFDTHNLCIVAFGTRDARDYIPSLVADKPMVTDDLTGELYTP